MKDYRMVFKEENYKKFWDNYMNRVRISALPKKLYMPSMDELYKMQDMADDKGMSMYKYLLAKAVEALIIDGVNAPKKGILKTAYKYLRENEDIVHSICMMYPMESIYSDIAKYDSDLCKKLISENIDNSIYNLDNLSLFNEDTLSNYNIEYDVISMLANKLSSNPKYRFEYQGNKLLDDIFDRKFDYSSSFISYTKDDIWNKLMKLEPAYVFTEDKELLEELNTEIGIKNKFMSSINAYSSKYNISNIKGYDYQGKDILTNPDENVKKLIKCINDRK